MLWKRQIHFPDRITESYSASQPPRAEIQVSHFGLQNSVQYVIPHVTDQKTELVRTSAFISLLHVRQNSILVSSAFSSPIAWLLTH